MFWDFGSPRVAFRSCYPLVALSSCSSASVSMSLVWLLRRHTGGPFFAAAAATTPRVDVEKASQAAAAPVHLNESSQVTSRCLVQKHPDSLSELKKEEREERRVQEDGGDFVLLVRGLQGNTMVVRCGSGGRLETCLTLFMIALMFLCICS